jgi:hypothetical protein
MADEICDGIASEWSNRFKILGRLVGFFDYSWTFDSNNNNNSSIPTAYIEALLRTKHKLPRSKRGGLWELQPKRGATLLTDRA